MYGRDRFNACVNENDFLEHLAKEWLLPQSCEEDTLLSTMAHDLSTHSSRAFTYAKVEILRIGEDLHTEGVQPSEPPPQQPRQCAIVSMPQRARVFRGVRHHARARIVSYSALGGEDNKRNVGQVASIPGMSHLHCLPRSTL